MVSERVSGAQRGLAGGEVGGFFAQGGCKSAEGAAPAGRGRLTFQTPHGGQADPGDSGELSFIRLRVIF
jgi:hypothetical protein